MVSAIEFRKGKLFGPSPHSHSVFLALSSPSFSLGGPEYLSMVYQGAGAAEQPPEEQHTEVD